MTMQEIEAKLKSLNQKYEQGIKQYFSIPANQTSRRQAQAFDNRKIDHELSGFRKLAATIKDANDKDKLTKKTIIPSRL